MTEHTRLLLLLVVVMGSGRLFRVGVGDYRGEVIKLVVVVVMGVSK